MDIKPREIVLARKTGETCAFRLCRLFPRHLKEMMHLQEQVIAELEVPRIFALSDEDEFIESILVDYCYGLFVEDKLIAIALCVLNRETYRNLGSFCMQDNFEDYVTFDTIQVHEEYRGYGIHRYFLSEVEKIACLVGAKYIVATIAPDNVASHKNFNEAGFEVVQTINVQGGNYGNSKRNLVRKIVEYK